MSDDLLTRVRRVLFPRELAERKMFGGTCLLLNGNMLVAVSPRGFLVRVGKDGNDAALARPHASPMLRSGRPVEGYVRVGEAGIASDADLKNWVDLAVAHVETLPAKARKPVGDPER